MPLHEWSPATQAAKLDRDFEDILNHFMSHDWGLGKSASMAQHPPAIESFIDADRLVIRADVPGVTPQNVEVRVDDGVLTIRGSRTAAALEERRDFIHREIKYGSFERAISIPKGVQQQDISAACRDGVLELTIPLRAVAVRRVPLQITSRAK